MTGTCAACGKWTEVDKCHIQTKGSSGINDESNIVLMCRSDHQLQHSLGWDRFICERPRVEDVLEAKGFRIVQTFGINKLRRVQ